MYINLDKLNLDSVSKDFKSNEPFSHIVLNTDFNIISKDKLRNIVKVFPNSKKINWRRFDNNLEKKLASQSVNDIPKQILELIYELNSDSFIKVLEKITGINNLIADNNLVGGGLHCIERGGKLGIHTDFGLHTIDNETVYRRVNLLLYLNENWKHEYNGHLELWNNNKECVKSILPELGTIVIFETNSNSWHGHPKPLTCPQDKQRKSIALYYYTKEKPDTHINLDTVFI